MVGPLLNSPCLYMFIRFSTLAPRCSQLQRVAMLGDRERERDVSLRTRPADFAPGLMAIHSGFMLIYLRLFFSTAMLVYQMVFPNGSNDHLEVFGEQLWEFTKVRHSLALSRSHFFLYGNRNWMNLWKMDEDWPFGGFHKYGYSIYPKWMIHNS